MFFEWMKCSFSPLGKNDQQRTVFSKKNYNSKLVGSASRLHLTGRNFIHCSVQCGSVANYFNPLTIQRYLQVIDLLSTADEL